MSLIDKFTRPNILYYPGCLTKFTLPKIHKNYQTILSKEGIDFMLLNDQEVCCGSPAKNAGDQKIFLKLAEKNLEVFTAHSIGKIITACPGCALVFRQDYPRLLGAKWKIKTFHITEIIEPKKATTKKKIEMSYHDSCHLGRGLSIYEAPRRLIESSGYQVKEMLLNREKSFCCGGGGGVKSNHSELSNQIAKDRIDQAKENGAEAICTACPMCYANLKENSAGFQVKELSELILEDDKITN